jgi:hypothetical protein
MKTHRMYRHQHEETPNILVLHPGVNYVPVEMMLRAGMMSLEDVYQAQEQASSTGDPYKAPEQVSHD